MDGVNQKNVQYLPKLKKNQNTKEAIPVEFPEDQMHTNELHPEQNESKAKFIPSVIKKNREKTKLKQRENNPGLQNEEKNNKSKNLENKKNVNAVEEPQMKKKDQKKLSKKKTNEETEESELNELSDETFELEDILFNFRVLILIQDLVNCFISNSTLPENELQTLKTSLFKRTCHVFVNILNSCVKKAFTRVLNSDIFQEFKNSRVSKKDACCQTDISDISKS